MLQFVINVTFRNKSSQFVVTVAFYNKKPDVFCNKLLSHFVIILVTFCNKLSEWIRHETVILLTPKIRFPMLMLCPMSLSPSSLESGGEKGVYHSPWTHTAERLGIFVWNLNHANKNSLETFWHTQVWSLKYLFLTIILLFLTLCCYFYQLFLFSLTSWKVSKYGLFSGPYFPAFGLNTERDSISPYSVRMRENAEQKKTHIWTLFTQCVYSINWVIKNKYIMLELRAPWSHDTVQKMKFLLQISSVNVTKSAGNCGIGHIYWRHLW